VMNILVSANDRYFMPLAVMLTSLFENSNNQSITVYFMYSQVSKENLYILKSLVEKYNHQLVTLLVSAEDFVPLKGEKRISGETFFRLLGPKYLPSDLRRILWLDCDAIVTKDIQELYDADLENCWIGGCIRPKESQKKSDIYFEKFGLQGLQNYINAGILLMDLNELRKLDMEKEIRECISKYGPDSFRYLDQDLINIIFHGKIKVLDYLKYNLMTNYKYAESDMKLLEEGCSIIHYAGKCKPWMFEDVPFADTWKKYFDLSPFAGTELVRVRMKILSELVGRCLKRNG